MRRNYQHDFPVNSLAAAAARVVFKRRALTAAAARDGKGIAWRRRRHRIFTPFIVVGKLLAWKRRRITYIVHSVASPQSRCFVLFSPTGLPNKACPRLRDLATALARGITQPRTNLIREPCTAIDSRHRIRRITLDFKIAKYLAKNI